MQHRFNFRLNDDDPEHRQILKWIARQDNQSESIRELIARCLRGVIVTPSNNHPIDKVVIERIQHMSDSEISRFLLDCAYERITGVDARTGNRLVDRVVVTHDDTQDDSLDRDSSVYADLSNVDW